MSETPGTSATYPPNWQLAADYDPNDHMMSLKGKDYLNVQHRLLWFIRDQRHMIATGLATQPYAITTDLIELDREVGWAHFRTTVRDVLGNEATAYGSESARDFPDYIEKAGTKSAGRALLMLGYGAAFAPELDEGERVVDSPIERKQSASAAERPVAPRQAASQAARPSETRQPAKATPAPSQPAPGATGASSDDRRVEDALMNRTIVGYLATLRVKPENQRVRLRGLLAKLDTRERKATERDIMDVLADAVDKAAARKAAAQAPDLQQSGAFASHGAS